MTAERLSAVLAIVTERWPGSVVQAESKPGSSVPSALHVHRDAQTFEWAEAEGVTERVAPHLMSIYVAASSTTFVFDDASPGAELAATLLDALTRDP